MKSIWESEVTMPAFPKQEGDLETEVLIIGGGMAGILCGYFLQKYGIDYCVADAGDTDGTRPDKGKEGYRRNSFSDA